MGRFGGIRTPFLWGTVIAVVLAGCSSSNKAAPPASTTITSGASSSTVPETSTSAPTSTPTSTTGATTVPATSAPTTAAPASVRITGYSISPASPICNSPTMIQLVWTATGANTVALAIDGKKFASYPGGHQSPLEYFACDGNAHTYLLTARGAGGVTATASKVVRATATG